MIRTNNSENDRELDDSLDLHPQSDDNFENELSKKPKIDVANNTVDEDEQQCSFQNKGITKLGNSITTLPDNHKEISKSLCEDGKFIFIFLFLTRF